MARWIPGRLVHFKIQHHPLNMSQPNINAITEDFEFAALSEAKNYRKAIVKEFAPFLKGRVLEIGAGIGQTTEALLSLPNVEEIVGIEIGRASCRERVWR